jgi:hypothetical protein
MTTRAPLPLQQHPYFSQALRRMGQDVHQIEIAGGHPIVTVRIFGQLLASRGPIWGGRNEAYAPKQMRFANLVCG